MMLERIGTASFQRTLSTAMRNNQSKMAETQLQLATGKKATIYRDMGTSTFATLSARSMLVREQSYGTTGVAVKQTLDRYDQSMSHLYGSMKDLYDALGNVIAMGEARGLDTVTDAAFGALKQTMNLNQSGEYLFAGGRSDTAPFSASTLDDLTALPNASDAFRDADVRDSARVSDGTDMVYGLTASDIGVASADALKALHELGALEGKLTDAQLTDVREVYLQVRQAMDGITDVQAANGQNMQQIDTYIERSETREIQLTTFIGGEEDVDIAEVTTRLVNDQLALQASYHAFSQIKDMSLINFL